MKDMEELLKLLTEIISTIPAVDDSPDSMENNRLRCHSEGKKRAFFFIVDLPLGTVESKNLFGAAITKNRIMRYSGYVDGLHHNGIYVEINIQNLLQNVKNGKETTEDDGSKYSFSANTIDYAERNFCEKLYNVVSDRYDALYKERNKNLAKNILTQAKDLLEKRENLEKEILQMIEHRNEIGQTPMKLNDKVSVEALDLYIAIKNQELETLGGKAVQAPALSQENQNLLAVVNTRQQ